MKVQKTSSIEVKDAVSKFIKAIALTRIPISLSDIELHDWGCPHKSAKLPDGKMAVYIFRLGDDVLKIGKVGPNSNARFYTQHYFPKSSQSNLVKSLFSR